MSSPKKKMPAGLLGGGPLEANIREQVAKKITKNQANNYEDWLPEQLANIVRTIDRYPNLAKTGPCPKPQNGVSL